jgi:hypothetical protein
VALDLTRFSNCLIADAEGLPALSIRGLAPRYLGNVAVSRRAQQGRADHLDSFIQGLAVNLEADAQAAGDTGITEEEHMRLTEAKFAALAGSGRFPYFAKLMHDMASFELDIDSLFELGLARLLDGFSPLVEGRARRRR